LTTISFEEELQLEENPWRARIITLLILLGITAVIGAAVWYFFMREEESLGVSRETEEITVAKGNINQTLVITGTADSELNSNLVFQSTGKVASVSVKSGDVVTQGQVLASLESEDLENAIASAEANRRAAELRLQDLLEGTDAPELAAAEQAVASTQAQLTKAENDYNDLLAGGTTADIAGAEQAVRAAEAQLASAQANREILNNGASDADIAAAEAGVAQSESALTAAKNGATSAANGVDSADAALKSAETTYCSPAPAPIPTPGFCSTSAAPISSGDEAILNSALGDAATALEAANVLSANVSYLNALNTKQSQEAAVLAAEQALASARARLDEARDGPSAEDVAAADAAVTSAEAARTAANERLALLLAGGTQTQQANAAAAVLSARAALDAALAQRDQAYQGPEANAIEQQRQAVETARLQVESARIRLKNAQIIAPFAGTVAAVNIKTGEFFGGAASLAEGAGGAIVLLTPDRLTLTMEVGETDYRNLRVGQVGGGIFDGIPGTVYPFTISEIGLSPTITQGVVTYPVKATLILGDNPRPAPGMNARGQIILESKGDILLIPTRAIRIRGTDQVVDVKTDDGIVEAVVTTGATDGQNVEVLTGLNEGDVVVVVSLTSGQDETQTGPEPEETLPGGIN
jgi:HlyD family secretion protein